MKKNFILDLNAKTGGTSFRAFINATYSELVKILGEPLSKDNGSKVTGEWILRDIKTNEVVTVYDWKATSNYDPHNPSVEEFRANEERSDFHIGAKDEDTAYKFKEILESILNRANSIIYITEE